MLSKTHLSFKMYICLNYFSYLSYYNYRYFGIYQTIIPVLMIKDPGLIKQITVKNFEHFVDHMPFVSKEVDAFWGRNLFSLKGKVT